MAELLTDCDWMALHIDALFVHDDRGRMLTRREPGRPPAPRFYLGRTLHGNLWRIRADEPPDVVRRLSRLAGKEAALRREPLPAAPERLEAMRLALAARDEIRDEWRGPVYRFPDLAPRLGEWQSWAEGTRLVDPGDEATVSIVRESFPELAPVLGERGPCLALIEAGRACSVCYSACGRPEAALEAGVDTLEGERGRGLAGRCVAAWALAVLERGAIPLYSTRWQNRASQAVARKLGLERYGEDLHIG